MLFDPFTDPRLFSPLRAIRSVQDQLAQLLDSGLESSTPMAIALYAKDDGGLVLRTPLPGVEAQAIEIDVDGNALTVSGAWPGESEGASATAQHVERPRGHFARTLHLPFEVDAARVQARLERGVLEVEIPRLEKNPPVKIQVLGAPQRN